MKSFRPEYSAAPVDLARERAASRERVRERQGPVKLRIYARTILELRWNATEAELREVAAERYPWLRNDPEQMERVMAVTLQVQRTERPRVVTEEMMDTRPAPMPAEPELEMPMSAETYTDLRRATEEEKKLRNAYAREQLKKRPDLDAIGMKTLMEERFGIRLAEHQGKYFLDRARQALQQAAQEGEVTHADIRTEVPAAAVINGNTSGSQWEHFTTGTGDAEAEESFVVNPDMLEQLDRIRRLPPEEGDRLKLARKVLQTYRNAPKPGSVGEALLLAALLGANDEPQPAAAPEDDLGFAPGETHVTLSTRADGHALVTITALLPTQRAFELVSGSTLVLSLNDKECVCAGAAE